MAFHQYGSAGMVHRHLRQEDMRAQVAKNVQKKKLSSGPNVNEMNAQVAKNVHKT